MGEIVMDWNSIGSSKGTVPSGTYEVKITGWQDTISKTLTRQVRWFAEVLSPAEFKGKSIIDHTPLTEKALWKLATLVKACAVDVKALPKMTVGSDAFNAVLECCVGRRVFWSVKYDEQYNNNKVDDYLQCEENVITPKLDKEETSCPF